MLKKQIKISTRVLLIMAMTGLTACSTIDQVSQSAKKLTNGGGSSVKDIDNTLIIPPSLKLPSNSSNGRVVQTQQPQQAQTRVAPPQSQGNYYIIVGTYPDQLDALDTFTRLSSIGLKGATMESRKTKAGKVLHMVRLGPYTKQEELDKAKDSLTNTGMSQFKIVKN